MKNKSQTIDLKLPKFQTKIKFCPKCNYVAFANKIVSSKIPFLYYVECSNCHWCGKTKLFLRRAIKSWNKGSKNDRQRL